MSHALRVRGLKLGKTWNGWRLGASHALRVRGLKHGVNRRLAVTNNVARSTRAWIETTVVE